MSEQTKREMAERERLATRLAGRKCNPDWSEAGIPYVPDPPTKYDMSDLVLDELKAALTKPEAAAQEENNGTR